MLEQLRGVAPTFVVQGNIGMQSWAATAIVSVGDLKSRVLPDIPQLYVESVSAGFAAVVFGHLHKSLIEGAQRRSVHQPRKRRPPALHVTGQYHLIWVSSKKVSRIARSVDRDGRCPRAHLGRHRSQNRIGDAAELPPRARDK